MFPLASSDTESLAAMRHMTLLSSTVALPPATSRVPSGNTTLSPGYKGSVGRSRYRGYSADNARSLRNAGKAGIVIF